MVEAVKKRFRLDVVADIISPLTVIFMEGFWVYSWLIWSREMTIFPWNDTPLDILSLLAVFAITFSINRFIPSRNMALQWTKLMLVVLTIGGIISLEYGAGLVPFSSAWLMRMADMIIESFSTLHPLIPALTAACFLAWRGMRLANSSTFSIDVFRSFTVGLVIIVLLIVVWAATMGEGSTESLIANAGLYIAGFFFFGLMGLAMGNFLSIRQRLQKEQSAPISNRRWFTILLTIVAGMVVIGLGISALFSPGIIDSIGGAFGNIIYYLNYALEWLFWSIGWLIELIWAVMTFLINLVRTDKVAEFLAPEITDIEGVEMNPLPETGGFDIMILIKWIAVLLILSLVIFLLYRATKRFRPRKAESGIEEYSESLWSWLGFKADIRLFFSNLFERWFGSRLRRMRAGLNRPTLQEEVFADDMNIREIYRHVLRKTAETGHSRKHYETPYEFADRLETSIPDVEKQIGDITRLYVNVRYGESSMKEWETEHANVMWRLFYRFFQKPKETR